jgi:hypothetical protein
MFFSRSAAVILYSYFRACAENVSIPLPDLYRRSGSVKIP